jgi:hypothetical protein
VSYVYRVAATPQDYQAAKALLLAEGLPEQRLSFPTILGYEEDVLLGFLATDLSQDMVVCGPLVLRSDLPRMKLALGLCEAYELAMRNLGIKAFVAAAEKGTLMDRCWQRYLPDDKPYAEDEKRKYFIRRL